MQTLVELIEQRFHLFAGERTEEEDQDIFDRVAHACFEEALRFIQENLPEANQKELTLKLLGLSSSGADDESLAVIISQELSGFPELAFPYHTRIATFIDALYASSLVRTGRRLEVI